MKTVIAGDSHVAAIGKALAGLSQDEKNVIQARLGDCKTRMLQNGADFLRPFHEVIPEGVRFIDPQVQAAAKSVFPSGIISPDADRMLYLSCGFHGVSMISSAFWKKYSINPKRVIDRRYISVAAFQEMVREYTKDIVGFLGDLKSAGVVFKVLCSPPLPPSYYEVPRPFTEEECWMLDERYKSVFASILQEKGVEYVLPPQGIYDGKKMRAELSLGRAGDHHGNDRLGRAYLAMLAA